MRRSSNRRAGCIGSVDSSRIRSTVTVTPDSVTQNGSDTATVRVKGFGPDGPLTNCAPQPSCQVRLEILNNTGAPDDLLGGTLSNRTLQLDSSGNATAIFTAPQPVQPPTGPQTVRDARHADRHRCADIVAGERNDPRRADWFHHSVPAVCQPRSSRSSGHGAGKYRGRVRRVDQLRGSARFGRSLLDTITDLVDLPADSETDAAARVSALRTRSPTQTRTRSGRPSRTNSPRVHSHTVTTVAGVLPSPSSRSRRHRPPLRRRSSSPAANRRLGSDT